MMIFNFYLYKTIYDITISKMFNVQKQSTVILW